MPEIPRPVPIKFWGKDHWSTLVYVETCVVDGQGELSPQRMRCDSKRHPEKVYGLRDLPPGEYPTMLFGGVLLDDHDDWDCLKDMEAEGLLEIAWAINVVALTDRGFAAAHALRKHRVRTGGYKDFVWEDKE